MKQGFLVPVYRHGKTAGLVVESLAPFGMPIILIDDGNEAETRGLLAEYAAKTTGVVTVRLEKNSGKGGAVIKGLETAKEFGLSHVLQMDADGQHDAGMISFFLEESVKHPDKIICACPEFDETAPKNRIIGRKISNFWATVVTLSTELKDVMCGFRVYPVDDVLRITPSFFLDKRMGFDVEILVRLYWKKTYPLFYPVKVHYPADGISSFHMVKDNIRISWMFSRLFFGMMFRFPLLILRKIKREKNYAR